MDKGFHRVLWAAKIILGCVVFALGFDLFLVPNGLNAGGLSGLAMIVVHVTGFGSVGLFTAIANLPLFALGGMKIGKEFFWGSLLGMIALTVLIDLFALLPAPQTEPLIGALYGGLLCGGGLGVVFAASASRRVRYSGSAFEAEVPECTHWNHRYLF